MKKLIEIDDTTLRKLKIISAFETLSVKGLMEKAIKLFVENKEKEQFESLSDEEKTDIGLLALMQKVDEKETVSEEEFLKSLHE